MKYSFKADCLNDVVNFLFSEVRSITLREINIVFHPNNPEVKVQLETKHSIEEVKEALFGCDYNNKMARTLKCD